MTQNEILNFHSNLTTWIRDRKLYEVFNKLNDICRSEGMEKYRHAIEDALQSYKFMLQYMADGVQDPERESVLSHLMVTLYDLNDRIFNTLMREQSSMAYYSVQRVEHLQNKDLGELLSKYKKNMDTISLANLSDATNIDMLIRERERLESEIFRKIWTSFPTSAADISLIESILHETTLPQYFRELIVSAILLGSLEYFEEKKLTILLDAYSGADGLVKIKSLVAALLIMYKYGDRVSLSSSIQNRIGVLMDMPDFGHDIKVIFLQFIKSRDTERISKKMQDELLPQIMKISPDIYRKIKDNNGNIDMESIEENPDWQEMLDKTGITKKMQELSEMQMEGGDVFMSTFAHLKNFPFFNEISNWFIPYHTESSVNRNTFQDSKSIANLISNAPFLCNSDKYSFALSLATVPEMQRSIMLSQFNSQNIDIKEVENSTLSLPSKKMEEYANKYVQDLYRFFKLYRQRTDFYDPFSSPIKFMRIPFIDKIVCDVHIIRLLGEFYFKHTHYQDATEYFLKAVELGEISAELFQKIGFSYQSVGDYDKAIEYYEKSQLLLPDNQWTLKHLATCYRNIKNYEKALECYLSAYQITPDNVGTTLSIGHLLLEINRPEEALKYYYKIDFLSDKSQKSWRPIAWCEFVLGNYEKSKSYYTKILEDNPTSQDYLNMGHLALVSGKMNDAIDYYKKSFDCDPSKVVEFLNNFENDKKHIFVAGVSQNDVNLVIDKILFDVNG